MECKGTKLIRVSRFVTPYWNISRMECKDFYNLLFFTCQVDWNISRMECKVVFLSLQAFACPIGIYPEWNVKECLQLWTRQSANKLEYIQNGM